MLRVFYTASKPPAEHWMEVLVGPGVRICPPVPPRTGEDLIFSDRPAQP